MVSCLGLWRPWCEHVKTFRSFWLRFLKHVRYFVGDGVVFAFGMTYSVNMWM